ISLVGVMNRDNLRSSSRGPANQEFHHVIHDLTDIARRIVKRLNGLGIRGVVPTVGFPMDMDRLGELRIWDISHKTVAVEAGLGQMGIHRNVIHPRFGNFILLETIVIDADLESMGRPLDYNPCLQCNLCVSACPVGAVHKDGAFDFTACMTHNYREFFGGFQDWIETLADAKSASGYRAQVKDSETASMWQSLSFGANYKAAYCMAVCPAGEDVYGEYAPDRKAFIQTVVQPLRDKPEPVYVQAGTPAARAVRKQPNKQVRYVKNRLRPQSVAGFLRGLPLVFNPDAAADLDLTLAFRFTGDEERQAVVRISRQRLTVEPGAATGADLAVTVDAATWVGIVNEQASPVWAVLSGRLKLRGNPLHLLRFQRCLTV
ncbi:MAG: alkyl sulfatase C-terminal domain-containing protein, partial [Nitrospinaceae bacterium]